VKARDSILALCAGAALLFPSVASGQRDCVSQAHSPPYAGASYTRLPSSEVAGSTAEVSHKEYQLLAGLYRAEIAGACVDIGLDYQYTRYEYRDLPSRNRDLHRLVFPIRFRYEHDGLQFQGNLSPGISTSSNVLKDLFDRAGSDDIQVNGRFQARKQSGDRDLFGGVAYDHSFGQPKLYPVAGLEFQATDRMHIRLAYPDPGARYELTGNQALTARLFPSGSEWHVVTDDFADEFDYRVEALRAQLTWSLRLDSRFSLDLSSGYEFDRRHVFTDDLGTRIRAEVEDQWLIGVGLRFGPSPLLFTHGNHIGSYSVASVQKRNSFNDI